ncbi:hypothetical protein Cni_G16231 [Canna indica]|uniref:Phospholipid/glycerol acyltransferase domain-containing protein n=1 Tax=Canna indica TaxID=4628 RepID=A0AAQ3KFQ6_9LILI|nr:hypothetical protein Cni_G16231 [Canna indica]
MNPSPRYAVEFMAKAGTRRVSGGSAIAARLRTISRENGEVAGHPSSIDVRGSDSHLFISNHRTHLDPLYISVALGRRITATTYNINRLSELFSPI